jgi:hypothetical protein
MSRPAKHVCKEIPPFSGKTLPEASRIPTRNGVVLASGPRTRSAAIAMFVFAVARPPERMASEERACTIQTDGDTFE